MKKVNIDKVSSFSICYDFIDENRETELQMLNNGRKYCKKTEKRTV